MMVTTVTTVECGACQHRLWFSYTRIIQFRLFINIWDVLYIFESKENIFEVINKTQFEVKITGVKLFSIKSTSSEKYQNDQLINFKSETIQNEKKKFFKFFFVKW